MHIHKLMVGLPIHWSIPTFIIPNKSSYFTKFRICNFSQLILSFCFLTSSSLKTTVQLHIIIFLLYLWFCLRKRNTITNGIENDSLHHGVCLYSLTELSDCFEDFTLSKNTRNLQGKLIRKLNALCREYLHSHCIQF